MYSVNSRAQKTLRGKQATRQADRRLNTQTDFRQTDRQATRQVDTRLNTQTDKPTDR